MIQKRIFILLFIASCFLSIPVFSQREVPLEEEEKKTIKELPKKNVIPQETEVYSIFNDFRIPVKENINASDLRYDGWVTKPGMYTFRCKDGKRVRLTFWYLDKGDIKVIDSEFINVTPAIDKCQKGDIEYNRQTYK